MNETLNSQLIVALTKCKEDKDVIINSIKDIPEVNLKLYDDYNILLHSSDFKNANIFIVSVDLDGFDGKKLYFEQKNRLRIIPFLFILNRSIIDKDWDDLAYTYSKDLFDFLEKPISEKQLKHKVNLMLTITNIYNMHTIDTFDGLRQFWKQSIIRDREILDKMKDMYRKGKD